MKNTCKNCKAFDKFKFITGEINGICRAQTPSIDSHNKWPPVKGETDWCLKHELKKRKTIGNFWG